MPAHSYRHIRKPPARFSQQGPALARGLYEMMMGTAPSAGQTAESGRLMAQAIAAMKSDEGVGGALWDSIKYDQENIREFDPMGAGIMKPVGGRIATRFPSAKQSTENPLASALEIDMDAFTGNKNFEHHMDLVSEYPGLAELRGMPADEAAERYVTRAADNLKFIHDSIPEHLRGTSKQWYDGANHISNAWAGKYGTTHEAVSGVLAALSPQKDWFMNASLGERTLDVLANKNNLPMTPEMISRHQSLPALNTPAVTSIWERIKGSRLNDLEDSVERALWVRLYDEAHNPRSHRIINPDGTMGEFATTKSGALKGTGWGSLSEVSKAVTAFDSGGNHSVVSEAMGSKHKVRSFYNNIYEPTYAKGVEGAGDVTGDTHAVAANTMRPLSGNSPEVAHNFGSSLAVKHQPEGYRGSKGSALDGVQGTYALNSEAYKRAGADRGVQPREMQSMTWEAIRGLFTDRFKTASNNEMVDNIWKAVDNGDLSVKQAQRLIVEKAGGFKDPDWAVSGGGVYDPARDTSY
jgi:hypothetical protein